MAIRFATTRLLISHLFSLSLIPVMLLGHVAHFAGTVTMFPFLVVGIVGKNVVTTVGRAAIYLAAKVGQDTIAAGAAIKADTTRIWGETGAYVAKVVS